MQTSGELRTLLQVLHKLTASTLQTVDDMPIHTSFPSPSTCQLSTLCQASERQTPQLHTHCHAAPTSISSFSCPHITRRSISSSRYTHYASATSAPASSSSPSIAPSSAESATSSSHNYSASSSSTTPAPAGENPSRFSWDEVRRTMADLRTVLFPMSPAEEEAQRRARMGPVPLAHALRSQQHIPSSISRSGRASKSTAYKTAPAAEILSLQSGGSYPNPDAYRKPEVLGILATEFDRKDSHFQELKTKRGEFFMGKLFKWGLIVLSIPVGMWVMTGALLNAVCVMGMEKKKKVVLVNKQDMDLMITLQRIRDYIYFDLLAQQFEGYDGTFHLVQLVHEGQPPDVMRSVIITMEHLFQFEVTMNGMLQSKVVERLEQAFAKGWIPPDVRDRAISVYLDLHAARRTNMEIAMMAGKEKEKKKKYKALLKANLLDANSLKPRPAPPKPAEEEVDRAPVDVHAAPLVQVA